MTSAEIIGIAIPVAFGLAGAFLWWPNRRAFPGHSFGAIYRRAVGMLWLVMGVAEAASVLLGDEAQLASFGRRIGVTLFLLCVVVPVLSMAAAWLQLNSSATLRPLKLTPPPNGAK